jgi:hypothetical protein
VFRIGGNTFYDRENEIPIKIPELKRSGIGLIAEFRGIPNGFPNQGLVGLVLGHISLLALLASLYLLALSVSSALASMA